MRRAKKILPSVLVDISRRYALNYNSCSIRSQRTIWGSCSHAGDISLNLKLLFCPVNLVEYVIVHELCHVKHHDHSPDFWLSVAACLPNYKQLIAELRKVEKIMPAWVA